MKRFLFLLAKYFDTLKLSTRLTVFFVFASLVIISFHRFFFSKIMTNHHNTVQIISRNQIELAALRDQEAELIAPEQGADTEILETINAVANHNAELYEKIAHLQENFGSANQMVSVLEDLVTSSKGLELISIHSGETENLLNSKASHIPALDGQGLYRHYIELTVLGNYPALANYVRQLEEFSSKVRLNKLSIKVKSYPVSTMKLSLYILSLERAWLGF